MLINTIFHNMEKQEIYLNKLVNVAICFNFFFQISKRIIALLFRHVRNAVNYINKVQCTMSSLWFVVFQFSFIFLVRITNEI